MHYLKNKYRMIFSLIIVFGCVSSATAGSQSGNVTKIYAHEGDVAIVALDGAYSNQPTCSTNVEWAFSLTTESGKAMYANLLSAAALDLNVYIHGYDRGCTYSREIPSFVMVSY